MVLSLELFNVCDYLTAVLSVWTMKVVDECKSLSIHICVRFAMVNLAQKSVVQLQLNPKY